MSEALQKLREIGAQKIYEQTHIPLQQLEALFGNRFEGMTKVQCMGFLSILEREYSVDLEDLREKALLYFQEKREAQEREYVQNIYVKPEKKRKKRNLFIIIFVVLFLLFIVLWQLFSSLNSQEPKLENMHNGILQEKSTEPEKELSVLAEENATQALVKHFEVDENETVENNCSDNNISHDMVSQITEISSPAKPKSQTSNEEKVSLPESFTITPRKRVWFGYIDLKSGKKYQKIVQKSITLDPKKEWLLLFGHGYVTLHIDGVEHRYSQRIKLRLLYKDGKLTKLTLQEYKKLNKGRAW
jgi:hypothetical protein